MPGSWEIIYTLASKSDGLSVTQSQAVTETQSHQAGQSELQPENTQRGWGSGLLGWEAEEILSAALDMEAQCGKKLMVNIAVLRVLCLSPSPCLSHIYRNFDPYEKNKVWVIFFKKCYAHLFLYSFYGYITRQPAYEKENSEFNPGFLHLKTDLVSNLVHREGVG